MWNIQPWARSPVAQTPAPKTNSSYSRRGDGSDAQVHLLAALWKKESYFLTLTTGDGNIRFLNRLFPVNFISVCSGERVKQDMVSVFGTCCFIAFIGSVLPESLWSKKKKKKLILFKRDFGWVWEGDFVYFLIDKVRDRHTSKITSTNFCAFNFRLVQYCDFSAFNGTIL